MNFMSILVVYQQIIRPGFHKYFSGHVPIQLFERWAYTSKIFYDKETEENNKNMFTNKHVNIFWSNIHWYMYEYFEINNV